MAEKIIKVENKNNYAALTNLEGMAMIAHSIDELAKATDHVANNVLKGQKVVARSNYEVAKSILTGSTNVLTGLMSISGEMERKNKTDEYYRLTDGIEQIEKELYEMGILKKAYDQLELIENPIIEMKEQDIKFLAEIFGKNLQNAQNIMCNSFISPVKFFERKINLEKSFRIKIYTEFRYIMPKNDEIPVYRIDCKIEVLSLGIQIPVEYLGITTLKRLDEDRAKPFYLVDIRDNSEVVCYLNGHVYPVFLKNLENRLQHAKGNLWNEIEEESAEKGYRDVPMKQKSDMEFEKELNCQYWRLNKKERRKIKLEALNGKCVQMYTEISSDDLSCILEKIKKDVEYDDSPKMMNAMSEFKVILDDVNRDIALQNLRLLYNQLRLVLRQFRFDSLKDS